MRLAKAETGKLPDDNSRFFATYTRGACQQIEHPIANVLIAEFGDVPTEEDDS